MADEVVGAAGWVPGPSSASDDSAVFDGFRHAPKKQCVKLSLVPGKDQYAEPRDKAIPDPTATTACGP